MYTFVHSYFPLIVHFHFIIYKVFLCCQNKGKMIIFKYTWVSENREYYKNRTKGVNKWLKRKEFGIQGQSTI